MARQRVVPAGKKPTIKSLTGNKSVPPSAKPPKKRRAKPGRKAIQEIKRQQKSTETSITKAAMGRLAREMANDAKFGKNIRVSSDAIVALQEAAEDLLVDLFTEANTLAVAVRGQQTLDVGSFRYVYKTHEKSAKCLREEEVVPILDA